MIASLPIGAGRSTLSRPRSLRKQGKIDEKVFAETRLRRGAYGQRYDNGQRHDGVKTQETSLQPADQRARIPTGKRRGCSASRSPSAG